MIATTIRASPSTTNHTPGIAAAAPPSATLARPAKVNSAPTLTAEQTRLVDVSLVGGYAIAPTWGDGHHTGYYTYALLRDRCPCPECSERRGAGQPIAGHSHEEHA